VSREFFGETKTPGGIIMPETTKQLCKFCGAAYAGRPGETVEKAEEGVRAHELQCRHGAKQRFIQAALSGPVAMKGGEAVIDTVESVLRTIEAGERTTWKEVV
jgi:hypothetical protein